MFGDAFEVGNHLWPLTGEIPICFAFPEGKAGNNVPSSSYIIIITEDNTLFSTFQIVIKINYWKNSNLGGGFRSLHIPGM